MRDISVHYASEMGWLNCAICNKPVDRIERMDDPMTCRLIYRAYCHGQVDEAALTHFMLEDSVSIKFTWAFQRQALEKKDGVQVPGQIQDHSSDVRPG